MTRLNDFGDAFRYTTHRQQCTDEGDVFDLLARPAWHRQAACRGSNPELFFPGRGEDASYARNICAVCPVTAECLEAGMGEIHGIWGGESQRGRKRLRRLRKAA